MARTRLIHPTAPLDEDVATMSISARLVWAYLPCHADRDGRLADNPFRLRLEIMPLDTIDMNAVLAELARHRHIIRYTAAGRRWIQIRNFARYQHPHKKEAPGTCPPPPDEILPGTTRPGNSSAGPENTGACRAVSDPDPGTFPLPACDPSVEEQADVAAVAIPEAVAGAMSEAAARPADATVALVPPDPVRDPLTWSGMQFLWGEARVRHLGGLPHVAAAGIGDGLQEALDFVREHPEMAPYVARSMDKFWSSVKAGTLDRSAEIARKSAFAFGCWRQEFGPDYEGFIGLAPKIAAPAARGSPGRSRDQQPQKPTTYAVLNPKGKSA